MNRFLAETLSVLNISIAFVIVACGVYLGYSNPYGGVLSLIIGTALGVLVAALACGLIAYLALIEDHLARIAGETRNDGFANSTRREPSL